MGSKTRLGSYCTKRANNGVNLVKSLNINTRLARPIEVIDYRQLKHKSYVLNVAKCVRISKLWTIKIIKVMEQKQPAITEKVCLLLKL